MGRKEVQPTCGSLRVFPKLSQVSRPEICRDFKRERDDAGNDSGLTFATRNAWFKKNAPAGVPVPHDSLMPYFPLILNPARSSSSMMVAA